MNRENVVSYVEEKIRQINADMSESVIDEILQIAQRSEILTNREMRSAVREIDPMVVQGIVDPLGETSTVEDFLDALIYAAVERDNRKVRHAEVRATHAPALPIKIADLVMNLGKGQPIAYHATLYYLLAELRDMHQKITPQQKTIYVQGGYSAFADLIMDGKASQTVRKSLPSVLKYGQDNGLWTYTILKPGKKTPGEVRLIPAEMLIPQSATQMKMAGPSTLVPFLPCDDYSVFHRSIGAAAIFLKQLIMMFIVETRGDVSRHGGVMITPEIIDQLAEMSGMSVAAVQNCMDQWSEDLFLNRPDDSITLGSRYPDVSITFSNTLNIHKEKSDEALARFKNKVA